MNPNEPNAQEEVAVVDEATRIRRAGHTRRAFLFKVSLAINGIVGAVMAVPIVGYLLGSATKSDAEQKAWIGLGALEKFPEGETRLATFRNPETTAWDGQTGDIPCWVRRQAEGTFQVFAINCAHLGCPVRWFEESKLFLCPCHGGAYYEDGSRASGPPERGLFEYEHKVVNGSLIILAGKMPTLAASASPVLTQIVTAANDTQSTNTTKPRCGSCQV
jgi:menaquinol-cytochrome c reductase iron-sulfur subunit